MDRNRDLVCVDTYALAESIINELFRVLTLHGVALAVGDLGTEPPLLTRGLTTGVSVERPLTVNGRVVGTLRLWTSRDQLGQLLGGLDVATPWIAVALDVAFGRARTGEQLVRHTGQRDATRCLLLDILAQHPAAAFLVDRDGQSSAMNERAARLLVADAPHWRRRILLAIGNGRHCEMHAFPVRDGEENDRYVVIEHVAAGPSLTERIKSVATLWQLTPRQTEVLRNVVEGASNKEIAQRLNCAEVTIENHLTLVFRQAEVDGRGQLMARVLLA